MDNLDEFLKKSAPKESSGNTTVLPKKSYNNVDDFLSASKPAPGYVAPKINQSVEIPTPIPPKKPSLINRASNFVDNLTARLEEGSAKSQTTWGQFPSSLVENLPFGVGEIVKQSRDDPETVSNVNFEDVLQGVVDTSKGVFKGLIGAGASLAMTPVKFKMPVLGEITNIQYNAAQRLAQGESLTKVIVEEGVINNIFSVLMLAGLAGEVASPRPTTIKTTEFKGQTPGGLKVKEQPKSFRLYEEPLGTQALTPDIINKLGVDLGPKYNPELPTYFKITGKANGVIKGEVVQVKPSYLETFLKKFGTDINKVPDDMIVPLVSREISTKQISESKASVVPESVPSISVAQKPEIVNKLNQILPTIKANPTDEHLIQTAKNLAQESEDPALVTKVEEAIAQSKKTTTQVEDTNKNLEQYVESAQQTPEKDLTQPIYEPYRPARSVPVDRVYTNTPSDRFIIGEYEGKPYTSDSFILEFNSDVQPPKKVQVMSEKDKVPSSDSIKKLIPPIEDQVKVEPIKVQSTEDKKQNFVTLEGDGVTVDMQQKYYDYFNKKYPNAVFMAVEPYKPVVVKSDGNMVGLIMPADLKNSKFKLAPSWEKPKPAQPKLQDIKVEKETPSQKKIKELEKQNKKLEDKLVETKKSPALSGGELGNLASPQGNKTITKIMERQAEAKQDDVQEVPKDFKISERAKAILEEFGIPVGEKSLSSRLLGVYKPLTKKVRVQALYDVTTVTHEAIHAIDDQIDFSKKLIADTGPGAKIRKRLTDIYEDIYPQAKRTHALDKRMKEGLAVLFENYFYDPASISAKYPDLVDAFIKPEGQYYNPLFTKLLDRMNELVEDYSKLSPEDRIGSRIRTGKEVVDSKTGFTRTQRLEYELFNKFEPLKRYGIQAGVAGTWDDPLVQAFNIMNKNTIITNWVKGDNTPVLLRNGNFRIDKGSVADYLKLIKGDEKAFRSYLVARRVVADNNTLNDLMNLSNDEKTDIIREQIKKLSSTIQRDDFSLQDATAVVEKYSEKFAEAEKGYDEINKRLIDVAEENDLIDSKTADLYRNEKGYASFKRYIEEELDSIGTNKTSSKSKVTSFKERTGSQLDIIDPIYSQITSINEIMGKAMENRLWNKVADLANKNPEISQRFEKIQAQTAIDGEGNISFPQEKDPNIIRIFRNGKREFYKVAPEFGAVVKQLRGKELDTFGQLLQIPASVFTRLTTSANPYFAVGNIAVDQFSALAQTKTSFKPVIDPAKSLYAYATGNEGMKAYVAMGGKRQTMAAYYDMSPEDITHKLTGGETKTEKVAHIIDVGLGILEFPSNTSEIMTRFSEYQRSIEKGDPMSVAMYKASEVTTPFQLQGNFGGRVGQQSIKAIPYLNATIQVLYKYGRTIKDDPKRVGSVVAALLTIGMTAYIMTYKYSSEKQKRLLSEQPIGNASRYIYFPTPDGESLFKLKIPENMGIFVGMAGLFVTQEYGRNKAVFDDYLKVVESALPNQVQVWNPGKMAISWIPQVLKPTTEVAFNKKTFPDVAPIVSEYSINKAPSEQYNAYTSKTSKAIAGLFGASPAMTEFWIRNQFGAVGGMVVGKGPSNPIFIQEKDYVMTGRSYNRFYENKTLVQQQHDEMIKNNPDKYTYEEKYAISKEQKTYSAVNKLLGEVRDIEQKQELPEDLKSEMYNILLKMDSSKDIEDVTPDIYKARDIISKLKNEGAKKQ